jgi:hypothetical protein
MIRFGSEAFTIDAAAGDTPRRTISGIAVRYNTPAKVSDGSMVAFAPGSLPVDGRAPILQMFHDSTKVIGTVTERVETEQGMLFSARISETALGSEALVLGQRRRPSRSKCRSDPSEVQIRQRWRHGRN